MLDYRDPIWATFDIQPILAPLLTVGAKYPAVTGQPPDTSDEHDVHIPIVINDGDTFERSMSWVFKREGAFGKNPNDKGNYYNGELIGTKWGISAASWAHKYDIPSLTKEQARDIYREHYWSASGADGLPWPLSLLVFDTAVLHGVGAATTWLAEVGPNPYAFAAKRLKVYTNSEDWHYFGAGWVNRVADLLRVVGEA